MPLEFKRAYAVRAVVVWIGLRLFVGAVGESPWSIQGLALAAAATFAIVVIDAEARGERQFLANLAIGRRGIASVILVTVVAVEAVFGLVVGLVRLV